MECISLPVKGEQQFQDKKISWKDVIFVVVFVLLVIFLFKSGQNSGESNIPRIKNVETYETLIKKFFIKMMEKILLLIIILYKKMENIEFVCMELKQ